MEKLAALAALFGMLVAIFSLGTLGYGLYSFWNHEIGTALFCGAWGFVGWTFSKMFFNIGG